MAELAAWGGTLFAESRVEAFEDGVRIRLTRAALGFGYGSTPVSINLDVAPGEADRIAGEVLDAFHQYG
jgi:hypothetical protein